MLLIDSYRFAVAGGLPYLVQQTVASDGDPIAVVSFSAPQGSGNLVIVCVVLQSLYTVVDVTNNGQTLTRAVSFAGTVAPCEIWYGPSQPGIDQVEVTKSASGRIAVNVSEWSGLGDGVLETTAAANEHSELATSGDVTSTTDISLTVACAGWLDDLYASGPTNAFVRMTPADNVNYLETAYLVRTDIATFRTEWNLSTSPRWTAVTAVFGTSEK